MLPDSYPLTILPDVVRYVWAMTGNLWLDSHIEGDNEYTLSETEVLKLEEEYQQALALTVRLRFFDDWFVANPAIAQPAIAKVFRQINLNIMISQLIEQAQAFLIMQQDSVLFVAQRKW